MRICEKGDFMNNKLIILLALDYLLSEFDDDYDYAPEEQFQLVHSKILESYGLTLESSEEEIKEIKSMIFKDIKDYKDKLLNKI